jgi:hypothetical protein
MLSVAFCFLLACHYGKYCYAKCRNAECRGANFINLDIDLKKLISKCLHVEKYTIAQ